MRCAVTTGVMSADDTETVAIPLPALAITVLDPYRESLSALKTTLDAALRQRQVSATLAQQVSRVLSTRDLLEAELDRMTHVSGDIRLATAQADRELRTMLNQVFEHQWIDLAAWREIRSKGTDAKWWWHLDQDRLDAERAPGILLRQIVYAFVAVALLYVSLQTIYDTTSKLVIFFGGALAEGASQIGANVVTALTVIAQVAFGGGISTAFASNITKNVNHFLVRLFLLLPSQLGRARTVLFKLVPVTRFFVGTVLFLTTVLLIPIVLLRPIAYQLRESVTTLQQPVDTTMNSLESAFMIDPNADYFAIDLTRLGLRYESAGNYDDALQVYERALATLPHQIYTAYRVAVVNLLLDSANRTTEMHVIDVIDQALNTIDIYRRGGLALSDINIREDSYVTQLNVLLLISRAKLFANLGLPQGAIQDLMVAESIALKNPDLFKLPGQSPAVAAATRILLSSCIICLQRTMNSSSFLRT